MTKKVVRPILPIAPDQYDPVYINQLARALETLIDEVRDADVNFQGIGERGRCSLRLMWRQYPWVLLQCQCLKGVLWVLV